MKTKPPTCVLCDKAAITTVAHIPVCAEHDAAYHEEARRYLPDYKRPFYRQLVNAHWASLDGADKQPA